MKASPSLMKILLAASLMLSSVSAFAFPTPDEMAANFETCVNADSTWMQRFGRYVVAFDLYDAVNICRENSFQPQRPVLAACNTESGYLYAGYYCQDTHGRDRE